MRTALLLLFPVLASAIPAAAVIVDRVAIAIGSQVITDSEIDQRIRLTAFENGEQPDFSPGARKLAASRLIDEKLVEHEMSIGRYPGMPESRKPALLAAYEKEHGGSAQLRRELAARGLTPKELMDDLARQQNLLTFLKLRFRPAVQVTEQEIRKYYTDHYSASKIPLNDVRSTIEQQLTDSSADVELDAWLKSHRQGTAIEYLEKDLTP